MPRPKMPDPTCTLTTDAAALLVVAGGDVEAGEAVLGGTVADGVELVEDELDAEDGTVMFTDDSCGTCLQCRWCRQQSRVRCSGRHWCKRRIRIHTRSR